MIFLSSSYIFYAFTGILAFLLNEYPDMVPILTENNSQIINIAGGVALMFAQFIVCFWYGFTRYPAGGTGFVEWLYPPRGIKRRNLYVAEQDMEDIRDVCSMFLHHDKVDRFNPVMFWICYPTVLIEQLTATITSIVAKSFLCLCKDEDTRTYGQHVSKSVAGLIVVMGYYLLWMYGNIYCKLAGTAALLVSQNLYNAVLFEKNIWEFLQSLVFGNFLLISLQQVPKPRIKSVHLGSGPVKDNTITNQNGRSRPTSPRHVTMAGHCNIETVPTLEDDEMNGSFDKMEIKGDSNIIHVMHSDFKSPTKARSLLPLSMLNSSTYGNKNDIGNKDGDGDDDNAARRENANDVKNSELGSPIKTRSMGALEFLKSVTFPLWSVQPQTPSTDVDNDNVSLDLSYIDQGKIETFVDQDSSEDEVPDTGGNNRSLDVSEILADLVHVEEKTIGRSFVQSAEPAEPPESPNEVLSMYRSTKRRIEEAFYSTRSFVEDKGRLIVSEIGTEEEKKDHPNIMTSRVDSYDFTKAFDEESGFQGEGSLDNGSSLPAMKVIDTVDDEEVKMSTENNGRNIGRKFRGFFGKSGEKKDDDNQVDIEPPILHIYAMDGHTSSFDDDFTRSGTWNSIETPKPNKEARRTRRSERRSSNVEEDLVCCSNSFIP